MISALLYPGLLTALAAGMAYRLLLRGRGGLPITIGALGSREGLAGMGGALLAGLGLATLPWPFHPAGGGDAWLLAWAAFELAFLLPLLPALMSGRPGVVRAAIREAQMGALARALIWGALGVALALHERWAGVALAAHLLALGAAGAALPAAVGWGPFGVEERVTPGGTGAGLSPAGQSIEAWARDLRAGALLAAVLVAGLPTGALPPALALAIITLGLALAAVLLGRFANHLPRLSLPSALRYCLVWSLPLALGAALALAVAARA